VPPLSPVNNQMRARNSDYITSTENRTRNTLDVASIEKTALAWARPRRENRQCRAGAFAPKCRKRECGAATMP
jgi:hypothetical protein